MSDPARIALTEAFALYLTAPPDECFQKRDSLIQTQALRKTPRRIRYDKDHALIVSLPNLNTVSGHQTRVSRINTTAKAASAMWAGKLIAAAENQALIKALWLRFCYDPYLDINATAKAHIERHITRLVFGLWCFYPRSKTPPQKQLYKGLKLLECVMDDMATECRIGLKNRKSSNTYKSEQMGYGKGKSAYQHADYSRAWAPVERDLRNLLTRLDQAAMVPVLDAYNALKYPQATITGIRGYSIPSKSRAQLLKH